MANGVVSKKGSVVGYLCAATAIMTSADKLDHVRGFGDFSSSNEEVEDSDFDDDSKTYSNGIADNGTQELTFNVTPERFDELMDYKALGTALKYEQYIKSGSTTVIAFRANCVINKVDVTGAGSINGLIEVKATLRFNSITTEGVVEPEAVTNYVEATGITGFEYGVRYFTKEGNVYTEVAVGAEFSGTTTYYIIEE